MVASVRQATSKVAEAPDVHLVQVGETVQGPLQAIHKDHAVVTLQPTGITAVLSLNNLANSRDTTVAQLRTSLAIGEQIDSLIVLSQNPDKGMVIVSKRPKSKAIPEVLPGNEGLTAKTMQVGQVVSGRVTGYGRGGTSLHIANGLKGVLHPTDACDDYQAGTPFPSSGEVVKGMVVNVDKSRRLVVLSSRSSLMNPSETSSPRDRQISSIEELKVGETVRGFVKNIAEHGLFVSLGRNVDARIQIKELFDEVCDLKSSLEIEPNVVQYIKDWKSRFNVNQLVQGKIAKFVLETKPVHGFSNSPLRRVDTEAGRVEMSLRSGPVEMSLRDFQEGQKVDGIIKKKEAFGVFVQIKDTRISGLCHKSEVGHQSNWRLDFLSFP